MRSVVVTLALCALAVAVQGQGMLTPGTEALLNSGLMPADVTTMMEPLMTAVTNTTSGGGGAEWRLVAQIEASEPQPFDSDAFNLGRRTLALVGDTIGAAGNILKEVKDGLNTLTAVLGLIPAEFKRWSNRAKFLNSEYAFAQTLYKDANSFIDKSDYLGDAAKYIKLYNKIADVLAGGALEGDVAAQIDRIAGIQSLLSIVADTAAASKK
ncbi:hypothetical protein FOA52_010346 [Chlamydomonas sp. UWO 241]|nr:hypothetical protein FOA52_010346 [Chlamydomonas sp. UWO 241]